VRGQWRVLEDALEPSVVRGRLRARGTVPRRRDATCSDWARDKHDKHEPCA
jgi:hypothetical protein